MNNYEAPVLLPQKKSRMMDATFSTQQK